MSSNIDISKPTNRNPSIKSIRDNFVAAATDIEELQNNKLSVTRNNDNIITLGNYYFKAPIDGSDCSLKWVTAHNFCATNRLNLVLDPNDTINISVSINYDYLKYHIFGNGATVNVINLNEPVIYCFSSSTTLERYKPAISAITFIGDNTLNGAFIKYGSKNDSEDVYAWGIVLKDVIVKGFYNGEIYGNNCWLISHYHYQAFNCAGQCVMYPSGIINSGEQIYYDPSCLLSNSPRLITAQSDCVIRYEGSLDYFTQYAISVSGGAKVFGTSTFIESNSDNDYWLKRTGFYSTIVLTNPVITLNGLKTNYEFFSSTEGQDGGIYLNDYSVLFTGSSSYNLTTLGVGSLYGSRKTSTGINLLSASLPLTRSNQNLVDGTFTNIPTNIWQLDDWKLYDTTANNTGFIVSNNTLKIKPQTGTRVKASKSGLCGAGAQIIFGFSCESYYDNSTDSLNITIVFFDNAGIQVGAGTSTPIRFNQTNQTGIGVTNKYNMSAIAPAGTASYRILLNTSINGNAVSGNCYCTFSDMVLDVNGGQNSSIFYDTTGTSGTGIGVDLKIAGNVNAGTLGGLTRSYSDTCIGNRVFFELNLNWTSISGQSGETQIQNLPRTNFSINQIPLNIQSSTISPGVGKQLIAYLPKGSKNIRLKAYDPSNGNLSDITIPNVGDVQISGSYFYGTQ